MDWEKWKQGLTERYRYLPLGPFKFFRGGTQVLGIQGPWLVLLDLQSKDAIRRVLPAQEFLEPKFPGFSYGNLPNGYAVLAINPQHNSLAAAFNVVKGPRLFLFDSTLTKPVRSWALRRYAADIGWLPDGKELAILYSGQFDDKYVFRGIDAGFTTVNLPDVEIVNPSSGKTVMKFFTGAAEAKIAFSNDGQLMYCISQASSIGVWVVWMEAAQRSYPGFLGLERQLGADHYRRAKGDPQ